MKDLRTRIAVAGAACCLAATMAATQGQAPPPAPPGADFLKRPPVVRLTPEMQQKLFLLPPGYKIEPVLSDPVIEDPVGRPQCVRQQRAALHHTGAGHGGPQEHHAQSAVDVPRTRANRSRSTRKQSGLDDDREPQQ